ncbi:MAG: phosphopentomutase [Lachnospiraceae bacterium]|nr:phosphopentomutase [Lachnospiraceae bacterium]MBP5600997.1 phosphopentomutase [Lachnospiraceae bacterium]
MKRVFLIVLDSYGCGEMPDAKDFGDEGSSTVRSVATSKFFEAPNLRKMGLYNIDGVDLLPKEENPSGIYCRCAEVSKGKDTTLGHWEIAGVQSLSPMPTYPDGFPKEVLDEFSKAVGRGVLCNKPYSGTEVIKDYGDEHVKTGDLIVYTSADSVFQIAAHEDVVPLEELYDICRKARKILVGKHGVGRVIARPFIGTSGNYTRTSHRHDFSLEPPSVTMLDQLKEAGKDVLAVGKINDIFAGKSITEYVYTSDNADGIEKTLQWMDRDFDGICFTNLVDTDMIYGHRRDIDGYAKAISYFDSKLPEMISKLKDDDVIMITADHGCDPGYTKTTDHTREYIPFLMYGKKVTPKNLGTRSTFADIGATVLKEFGIDAKFNGTSMI